MSRSQSHKRSWNIPHLGSAVTPLIHSYHMDETSIRTGKKSIRIISAKLVSINQSINQSNLYSASIRGVARLGGATARSVFKCEVVEVVP